jgi:hypothetical protein
MGDRNEDSNEQVLAELRLMREHMSALVAELRTKKRKATKRSRTLAKKHRAGDEAELGGHKPTDLEVARARRYLKR